MSAPVETPRRGGAEPAGGRRPAQRRRLRAADGVVAVYLLDAVRGARRPAELRPALSCQAAS